MAVQVSGIEQLISIDRNLLECDQVYSNPLYGQCQLQIDFPILQQLYTKGNLVLDQMFTRTCALPDLLQAFTDIHAGRNAKGVIVF